VSRGYEKFGLSQKDAIGTSGEGKSVEKLVNVVLRGC